MISAGTLLDASIVMHARLGDAGLSDLDDLLSAAGVRLNYGGCFAYALATVTRRPLLFKGSDFSQTDIAAAAY